MDASEQKVDRRVLYTKMFLREALLELMREKPIAKITTTELCQRAGINRNTFYTHYQSVEELLASIEDELFVKVRGTMERLIVEQKISNLIEEICIVIAEHFELSRILLSENGDTEFLTRLISLAHDQTLLAWRKSGMQVDDAFLEIMYTYSVYGSVAIIRNWVRQGMPQPPKTLADQLERLNYNGLNGFSR